MNNNNEDVPDIFNISNNILQPNASYNDLMISAFTNMLTNRIISNNNSFFPISQNPLPRYNFTNILENSLYQKNPYKKVTSDKGLSQLKIIKFKGDEHETKFCSITQDEFKEGEEIVQLPCKHIFDKDAIHTWLKEESHSCPVCRYELDFKEITEDKKEISEVLTDSDEDMPELEEVIEQNENEQNENEQNENQDQILEERREELLSGINRILRNIQFVNEPSRLHRQVSFDTNRDLQYALMASLNETQECNEKSDDDFLVHPDTQHDEYFDDIVSDIDSDDDLNEVD
tara:strand:+ start:19958 stop:20821 length:864 start_codon:yes stop_codon:yes gene_type:complete